jgi:hypothetical protein
VFDLLYSDGKDWRRDGLADRKAALRSLLQRLPNNSRLRYAGVVDRHLEATFLERLTKPWSVHRIAVLTSRQSVDPPISTRYPVDLALLLEDNPHHFEEPAARCFGSFERPPTVFPRLIAAFQGNPSVPPVWAEKDVCPMEPLGEPTDRLLQAV